MAPVFHISNAPRNWLFGVHSLCGDTLLSHDIGRRGFALPQFDILDFVDSQGVEMGEVQCDRRGKEGGGTGVNM